MGILNFIAALIIMILLGSKSDDDLARELHDGWISKDEIGDLLDMSEEEVDEAIWENDHHYHDYHDYDY